LERNENSWGGQKEKVMGQCYKKSQRGLSINGREEQKKNRGGESAVGVKKKKKKESRSLSPWEQTEGVA